MQHLRILASRLRIALREFPAVCIVGPRQVGKTTLALLSGKDRAYVTLDDLGALQAAQEDPEGFVGNLPRPVTLDEIQRAPELLLPIKREIDRTRKPGAFLITGSSRIQARRGMQETLAGRAALLRLRPMTWAEASGNDRWNPVDALWSCRSSREVIDRFGQNPAPALDPRRILAGGFPIPLLRKKGASRARWFAEYRATYIQQDVPPLLKVEEVPPFVRFVSMTAAQTAQTTNHAALARDTGISTDTALRWFGLLETTFLVDPIPSYQRNRRKRLVKSPKVHFGDAGLAAYLAGVRNHREASRVNIAGALLETLVAQHLLAFCESARKETSLLHYRSHGGAEVDFVLEQGNRTIPIEVKMGATARPSDTRGIQSFLKEPLHTAPFGLLLYGGTDTVPLTRSVVALPLSRFLEGPSVLAPRDAGT
jgi:predicted AAA+ superfamily ATPase